MKYETDSFIVWLNAGLQVMLAKCKKTGRFVKRAIAAIEVKMQDVVLQFGFGMALAACVSAIPSALLYIATDSMMVSVYTWAALMLATLLVLPLKLINELTA